MPKPLVSIILLSALRMKCTQKCIESIFQNTKEIDFEIIIVDMGKDEALKQWLTELPLLNHNIKVIFNQNNVGTSRGRNQAIKEAQGEYLLFLDNDTIVTPFWLQHLLETVKRWPKACLFGAKLICQNGYVYFCDKYIYDSESNGAKIIGVKITSDLRNDSPEANKETEVSWYPTGCLLAKKETIEEIEGFDENLVFVEEDKDLSLKVRAIGGQIIYCPESVVIHERTHDEAYDTVIRFGNIARIKEDIKYFELKWQRKVDLIYSRQCLENLGYSIDLIDSMAHGELEGIFTLIDQNFTR